MDKLTNETNASDTESQEQPSLTPGSVHLVDLEQRLQAKHASGRDKDIVLDPAPSSDPDDPLNWSPRRKLLSTICLGIYATIIAMGTAVTFAIIVPMSKATELTVNDLNAGTGYIYLLSGWSALLVQPLALQYGKRPVYLISLLAHVVVMVWAPYTRTNGQWIANKIVQGFFAAPVASLCEASVADVYYTHQRGRYMAVFTMCIVGGVTLAPVIFGFVNDGQGWRWVLFWMGIFAAVAFVFCFLFMEETNYYRRRPAGASSSSEKAAWESPPRQLDPLAKDEEVKEATFDDYTSVDRSFTRGKPKSFLQKLYLFDREASRRPIHLKGMMVRPLVFFSFPIICYAGFCWGCIVVSHIMYNATASLILSNPPYNFSARMVGLSFIAGLIGVIIAAAFSGKFGDWFIIQMARRNGGVMEPEHRQWLFLVSVVLLPASLILWGVGAAHHIPWPGLIIGEAMLSITNALGTQLSIAYCIDSYRALGGEAMITVVIIRNTMAFAVGYGVTPWVVNMGFQNAFILGGFVLMAQAFMFLVFVKWGKEMRARSAKKYKRYVDEMRKEGMVH